ncbi:insulinase family protein [Motiliproteus sediminis]|uniref:insulinase family protein n=1 Tax=Motiliproteus sediminis TaxID=1468178 RepID=UPI001AEFEC3B|nr:insulinase family protein [Motiliproteus sediminis]
MTALSKQLRFGFLLLALLASAVSHSAELITSPADNRSYRALDLDNGLKVLLISSPDADKAAASLEVSVGSGADPEQHPGLAHFLEHMLFLGTEKYPQAGAYQAFISEHGGRHNAFTAYDRTNYFFDVDQQHLEPALDRFAQFFINPLFTPEYVDRERHAVHSEYQSKLKDDGRRGYAALKQALNPEHPLAKFSVGSLDTLSDQPDSDLQTALREFYQRHYNANRMSLVIQGPQSLDTLEQWTRSKFNAISSGDSTLPLSSAPLFQPKQLPAQLNVQSLRELYQLSATFPVPPVTPYWDKKPLHYLGALIGHEGPTSLLAELKRRGWAQGLSAGAGFNHDDAASFSVNVELTPEGFAHYNKVVDLLFSTINLIARDDIEEWRYAEERQISETAFRFKEPSRELYDVLRLAGKLRRYPTAELLHGDYLFSEFDPELIRRYLSHLNPDNLLLTLTASEIDTDRVEPYYQTRYQLQAIDNDRLQRWRAREPVAAIQLPKPNPFLAEDFSLQPLAGMERPQAIVERPGLRFWYQQDDDFRFPRANLYLTVRSPVANDTVRHNLLTALFVKLVNDQLNSYLYPANVAGFSTSLYPHIRGFSLRLSGYSDKQERLLQTVVDSLPGFEVDPDRFAIIKTQMRQQLENRKQSTPYELAFDQLQDRLMQPGWSIDERLAALEAIDAKALQAHIPRLLGQGNLEALAHGNLSRDDALELAAVLEQRLLSQMKPVAVAPGEVQSLEVGLERLPVAADHNDKAVILYLQGQEDGLKERALFGLINKLISAPFYTELRTEKQRGYVVFSTAYPLQERAGIALVVQSPSTATSTLVADINSFLDGVGTLVEAIDDTRLQQLKQSLLVSLLERDKKLSDRTNRYWQELDREYLNFDSREQLAAAIRAVSRQDLLDTAERLRQRQLLLEAQRPPAN